MGCVEDVTLVKTCGFLRFAMLMCIPKFLVYWQFFVKKSSLEMKHETFSMILGVYDKVCNGNS
jgi:hypothetical protein